MKHKGIIIFGTMGSGKDTLAAMLQEEIFMSRIYKLGEDIRAIVDKATEEGDKRHLYQEYGQAVRQILGINAWNFICNHKIKRDINQHPLLFPIIADGRQVNEYEYWEKQGFLTVGITSNRDLRIKRLFERDSTCDVDRMVHDTELQAQYVATQMAQFKIENNFTQKELKQTAQMISTVIKEENNE